MLSVAEALERVLAGVTPTPIESVALDDAHERVLAGDVAARLTQPPFAASAMDGYAVRAADVARLPVRLKIAGYAPAGGAQAAPIGPGQAVRIFTGAPLPEGADTIVIQEDTEAAGEQVLVKEAGPKGAYVR